MEPPAPPPEEDPTLAEAFVHGQDKARAWAQPLVEDLELSLGLRAVLPARFGRYVILDKIGSGGMGVVLAAYDPDLDRRVAIKLLFAASSAQEDASTRTSRFLREGQAMAKLDHPNVVKVHDVGRQSEKEVSEFVVGGLTDTIVTHGMYLVMELVEGENLRDYIKRGRPWREVLPLLIEAGRGLQAAHAAGLAHRDFKPANVFITPDGHAKVGDFGLARTRAGASGSDDVFPSAASDVLVPDRQDGVVDAALTKTGTLVGTPAYMAPEQHRGEEADACSDRYAYCVVVYEALYGVRPFAGDDSSALAEAKLAGPPHERPHGSTVPAAIHRAVVRGLEPEPPARFESMAELLAELGRDLGRRRRRVGIAAAAALAVLCGLWASRAWEQHRVKICEARAGVVDDVWSPERRDALAHAFARTNMPYSSDTLASVSKLVEQSAAALRAAYVDNCLATRVDQRQSETRYGQRETCLDERLSELDVTLDVLENADEGTLVHAVGLAADLPTGSPCEDAELRSSGPPSTARSSVTRLIFQARAIAHLGDSTTAARLVEEARIAADGVDDPTLSTSILLLDGQLEAGAENRERARTLLRTAVEQAEAIDAPAIAVFARLELAGIHVDLGDFALAEHSIRLALASIGRHGLDASLEHNARCRLATALRRAGELDAALEQSQRCLEVGRAAMGTWHPDIANALDGLAASHHALGQDEQARTLMQQGLELRQQTLGSGHPKVAESLINLAALSTPKPAVELIERALDVLSKSHTPSPSTVSVALFNLATNLAQLGDPEGAIVRLEQALKLEEEADEPAGPMIARIHGSMAGGLIQAGRPDEALVHLREALVVQERTLGSDHLDLLWTLALMGRVLRDLHQPAPALDHLQRGIDLCEAQDQLSTSQVAACGFAWHTQGVAYRDLGDSRRAIAAFERGATACAGNEELACVRLQFELAQAIFADDPQRAHDSADRALRSLSQRPAQEELTRRVETWIEQHPRPTRVISPEG